MRKKTLLSQGKPMMALKSALMASTVWLASCGPTADGGPGFMDSMTNVMANVGDTAWDALKPVMGTGADFALQVVKRGCGDSPFVGRSPVETLGLTMAYVETATNGYGLGISKAAGALALQQPEKLALVTDLEAFRGSDNLGAAFSNLNKFEKSSDQLNAMEASYQAILDSNEPLKPPVVNGLRDANKNLYTGNHFQVDAAVGLIMLGAYFADAYEHGGGNRLYGIMKAEFDRGKADSMAASFQQSPAGIANLALNFMNAYKVHRIVADVSDYGEAEDALKALNIEQDISSLERAAEAQAASTRGRHNDDGIEYKPTGTIVRDLLIGMMQRRGVNPQLAKITIDTSLGACEGAFGTSGGATTLEAGVQLNKAQVAEAQGALISLGFLQGSADGVPGPKTKTAVQAFQKNRGLPATGELNGALLNELRAGNEGGLAGGIAGGIGKGLSGILTNTLGVSPAAGPNSNSGQAAPAALNDHSTASQAGCDTSQDSTAVGLFKQLAVTVQQQLGNEIVCP